MENPRQLLFEIKADDLLNMSNEGPVETLQPLAKLGYSPIMNLFPQLPYTSVFSTFTLCFLLSSSGASDITIADQEKLLAQRAGFAREVTGGYKGTIVHVTTDATDGPGSLREAVSGDEPRWVVFDGDYTIRSTKGIEVGSNKTIDGRGRKVTVTAHTKDGLVMEGVRNVIIENLILHDFGDIEKTKNNNPFDAIRINRSHRIWVDHCDLSMAGDKLVSVGGGSTEVTISWNHWHDQEQVFQIGSMSQQQADANQTVTSHHNFFNHTGYRHPVVSYGKVHAYNNYILGWKLYGVRSEKVAQVYLQNNIFEAGEEKRATLFKPAGKGMNDKKTLQDDRPGYLKAVGDLVLNDAKILENQPELVFDPAKFYPCEVEVATPELAKKIAAQAGWQPPVFFEMASH